VVQAAALGDVVVTLALRPVTDGVARLVPGGAVAGAVLLLDGDDLVLVQSAPPDRPVANLADSPIADRQRGPGDRVLASGPRARSAFALAGAEWRVLTAAAMVGMAVATLDLTVAYVQQRHQFGKPIGSFQSLQHGLAEFPGMIDGGRLLVHEAAWSLTTGQPSQRGATGQELALMALTFTGDTARELSARSIQYHGGYGYALEQEPQLYYRRSRGWSLAGGSVEDELAALADLTFGAI
jgi:alkylation response protein AidB-like acyl-CoA dehydrogenase